jgi:hypothetical protein
MYFQSQVRDASECTATATDGKISFPAAINSPAATCADTFAWSSFLETIQSEFWNQRANGETVWVANPKPICSSDGATDCCFVDISATPQVGYRDTSGDVRKPDDIGAPGKYFPYIPGDWGGAEETSFAGGKPGNSHNATFLHTLDPARVARQGQVDRVPQRQLRPLHDRTGTLLQAWPGEAVRPGRR